MAKLQFSTTFLFIVMMSLLYRSMAGPVELEKSSDDDLSTSETFGYGYYQPGLYSSPVVAARVPLATTAAIATPLTTTTTLTSASNGYARSGYGYGSGYKYGSGYDYGKRWGYGGGSAVNEFYRRHPVYVAWG
ncbi:uncharacterized protein LOC119605246 [Lucilia sericata]|uniref:uncharacterized protein LOC119605246 n=1 Tax=Lucilia sericata TaxID=13632 RepID=UPI0018A7EDEC|nr:uncharacterized protein LOC119605246 [Lucilia sericata]